MMLLLKAVTTLSYINKKIAPQSWNIIISLYLPRMVFHSG